MNKIEVDPKLFITCRLCLDDLGIYQIVPGVKEQIWYCFEIAVEPFDGLPQLICKKCEAILNNYALIKKTFISKQNDLLTRIRGNDNNPNSKNLVSEPVEPVLSNILSETSSKENDINEDENVNESPLKSSIKSKKKRVYLSSTSSSDSESPKIPETESTVTSWKDSYRKDYVCRVCGLQWASKKLMLNHFSSRHYSLKKKYKYIFKKHCEVKLYTFDEKINITGSMRNVMHDNERIIENQDAYCYILYTPKFQISQCSKDNIENKNAFKRKSLDSSDDEVNKRAFKRKSLDSSDDDNKGVRRNRKSKKYSRRCSNETVVLDPEIKSNDTSDNENTIDDENENNIIVGKSRIEKTQLITECINIDDSTDSEKEDIINKHKKSKKIEICSKEYRGLIRETTLKEIVLASKNKQRKKQYSNDNILKSKKNVSEMATQLKRKILSLGRKIINNKKLPNCTPLLRFMEYKHLEIMWLPQSYGKITNTNTNYIRILSRPKNNGENELNEPGWSDYDPSLVAITEQESSSEVTNNISQDNETADSCKEANETEVPECSFLTITLQNDNANIVGTDTRKLLNANPVANPKHFPKKITNEAKVIARHPILSNVTEITGNENTNEICMPIITSTTSLAEFSTDEQHNSDNNQSGNISESQSNKTITAEVPRIKVKSVSELMSKETLSRMNDPSSHSIPCTVNSVQIQNDKKKMIYISYGDNPLGTQNIFDPEECSEDKNCIILDTVELPNTKTRYPINYFQSILQMHGITLLDIGTSPPIHFNCLLKFKVVFKQPAQQESVILSLSLFCSKASFIMNIKDRNQKNINMSKISANWQWEVLKVYKGEVINKILANAQKISSDVFQYTKSFLCLLKSINCVTTIQ